MKRLVTAVVFFLAIASVFGADTRGPELIIRFYDKQIYYLSSEPVMVQVTVMNHGSAPYRFRLAEDRAFSLDFNIKTLQNRVLAEADGLLRKRSGSRAVYYRDVTVEAGESFSFVEDIHQYAAIKDAGSYIVEARLYPEAYRAGGDGGGGGGIPLVSNRLQLAVRPPSIPGPGGVPVALDVETKANLVRERLPPDEVVAWTLTARQKSQWEKFFLYIDLESMVSRDGPRQRQWRAESEEGRLRMIERYRTDLQRSVVDGDIAMIPSDFIIERTAYNAENAEVTVIELFRSNNFTERRRYTYYLRRAAGVWSIIDYMVINLGTE